MRLHFSPSDVLGLSVLIGIIGGISAAYIVWQFPLFPSFRSTLLLSKPTPCDSALKRFIHSLPLQAANDSERCSNMASIALGGLSSSRDQNRAIAPNSKSTQTVDARSRQFTRCEQDRNKYWSGDLLTINFMNSPEGQEYRGWCYQFGVNLPTVSHVYDVIRSQPNLCLVMAQNQSYLMLHREPIRHENNVITALKPSSVVKRHPTVPSELRDGFLWIYVETGWEEGWLIASSQQPETRLVQGCLSREEAYLLP